MERPLEQLNCEQPCWVRECKQMDALLLWKSDLPALRKKKKILKVCIWMRFGICTKLCSQFSCLQSWIPAWKVEISFQKERERKGERDGIFLAM